MIRRINITAQLLSLIFISFALGQTYSSADFPHPSFSERYISGEELAEILKTTERERDMSEIELVDHIEDKSMAFWVSCPNCEGGFQGGILSWNSDDPQKVSCKYCKMTYPNDSYPENKVQEIRDGTGNIQKLSYYEDPESRKRYYFRAKARNGQFIHLLGVVYNFARIYAATGDTQYARKTALLLNRMAEVYPKLLPHAGIPNDGGPSRFTDLSLPHEYYSGKIWDWWYAEIPWQCAVAYDLIYHSGELEKLSSEVGIDVKNRVENDLLRNSVEYVLENPSILSNAEISTMTSMIAVGRAIGEPGYIHEAIHRAKELLDWHFFRDGMWMEFCYYHIWVVNHYLRLELSIQGYSDPVDYTDPIYGTHFDNFDPQKEFPKLKLAKTSFYGMYLPDGFFPSTGDTKYNDRNWYQPWTNNNDVTRPVMNGPSLKFDLDPLEKSSSGILPGVGYSWLGMGSGINQIYAGLNFCETAGHVHYDGLNLSIWAFGHQLLPDLGYTHTRMRWWSWGTMAHNTVLVNGKMQRGGEEIETGGDLLLYDINDPGVNVVEAENILRYNTDQKKVVDVYRRKLVMWNIGGSLPLLIDIFRVQGGESHEWLAHGPVYDNFTASLSVPLEPRPGTLLGEDKTYDQAVAFLDIDGRYNAEQAGKLAGDMNPRYGFIHDLQFGRTDKSWILTFSPTKENSEPNLDLHMIGDKENELILGKAPAIVPAKENDETAAIPQKPVLLVRRQGDSKLTSIFPAVWEAHASNPLVEKIQSLDIKGGNELDVGFIIKLKSDDRKLLVISLFNPERSEVGLREVYYSEQKDRSLAFSGDLLLATLKNNELDDIHVWNCRKLSSINNSINYQGVGNYQGELSQIIRGQKKFILNSLQELPDKVQPGRCILVELPDGKQEGFIVDKWERSPDNPFKAIVILKDDPGLDGNARAGTLQRMTYPRKVFPPLTYTGIRWKLSNHVHFKRDDNGSIQIVSQ
jgi:hypothetical protein